MSGVNHSIWLRDSNRSSISWGIFIICILGICATRYGEYSLPDNPSLGSFLAVICLVAVWTLPLWPRIIVCFLAAMTPVTAFMFNALDLTAASTTVAGVVLALVLTDVTVRVLLTQKAQQDLVTKQLRDFSGVVAHEIRNPLAAITSDLETALRFSRSADELAAAGQRALHNAHRLMEITESVLMLARSDAGSLTAEMRTIFLADVIEEAVERWQSAAQKNSVALEKRLAGDGEISGDELMLGRLLDNLLANAVRHSGAGGLVTVDLRSRGNDWLLTVGDSGAGIPRHLRAKVFEPFYRADPSRSRATGGAGLGLALCAAIAHAHGAAITVGEAIPSGARLLVTFPGSARRAPITQFSGSMQSPAPS